MHKIISENNYHSICDKLGKKDPDLQTILYRFGYPPLWSRPNNFETLVHIILEQQVSLASAKAALEKLRLTVKDITPFNVLQLTDSEMKAAYMSRQKTRYIRELATAIGEEQINLNQLADESDETVRNTLTALPGIGNWTVDIYLIMVLNRPDIFPSGDLAVVKALKEIKALNEIEQVVQHWQPYRTVATMILWHYYLCSRARPAS